jgi:replication-associated recombination protein RarA
MLAMEHMAAIREDMTLYADCPGIYVFDEFHRSSSAVQMAFLKLLETSLRCSTLFCFASANTDSVTQPLLQRLNIFCLERPTAAEFAPLIRRISGLENIQIMEPAAPEALANACGRIPRVVLKALEMLAFDGEALSRASIAELCKRLSKIESGTENTKPKMQHTAVY